MRSPARRALKARGPGDGGAAPPRVLARFLPCLPPAGRTLPWPVRMVLDASSTTLTQPLCACLRALPGSIARALWLQARRGTFSGFIKRAERARVGFTYRLQEQARRSAPDGGRCGICRAPVDIDPAKQVRVLADTDRPSCPPIASVFSLGASLPFFRHGFAADPVHGTAAAQAPDAVLEAQVARVQPLLPFPTSATWLLLPRPLLVGGLVGPQRLWPS
jgi:hypothetical protein